jgi:hypothetical protein
LKTKSIWCAPNSATSSTWSTRHLDPGRIAGGRGRQGGGPPQPAQAGHRLPELPVHRRSAGNHRQALAAPRSEKAFKKYNANFRQISLFTVDDVFGGWKAAQKKHFDDGGEFDKIYQANKPQLAPCRKIPTLSGIFCYPESQTYIHRRERTLMLLSILREYCRIARLFTRRTARCVR